MINVLLVDDHILFAEGLKSMFKPSDAIEIIAHTTNGNYVAQLVSEFEPDLIIMDIDMPIINGIETMSLLKAKGINIPILMLTMHQSIRQVRDALSQGAQGYILKDASKKELIEAITTTSQGKNYFHSKINDQVFEHFRSAGRAKKETAKLSEREIEIIKCLARGMNSKAICADLFISEHTVRTHRKNIMHKLGVNTAAELIRISIEKGLIDV